MQRFRYQTMNKILRYWGRRSCSNSRSFSESREEILHRYGAKEEEILDNYGTERAKAYYAVHWIPASIQTPKVNFYRGYDYYHNGDSSALILWHKVTEAEKESGNAIYTTEIQKLIPKFEVECGHNE